MEKLKTVNFKIAMLLLLGLASPFVSPSIAMPVAILCFAGMLAMDKWFTEQAKPEPDEELKKEVAQIKNMMTGIVIKNSSKPEEAAKEFKRFF